MSKTKKALVIISMVILLVATAYVNILLNDKYANPVSDDIGGTETVSYFERYRSTRESSRTEQITYLDGVIASAEVTDDAKQTATDMKLELVATMEAEVKLEGLIKGAGFDEVVVTMSDDNVNVIVSSDTLDSQTVARIATIVTSESNYTVDQVVIRQYS